MKLVLRFWYLFVIFISFFAATLLIQLTESSPYSRFFIEWAKTWSTLIGALAAVVIVFMAFVTYWDQRRFRLVDTKSKIDRIILNVMDPCTRVIFSRVGTKGGEIVASEFNSIKKELDEFDKNSSELTNLGKMCNDKNLEAQIERLQSSFTNLMLYIANNTETITISELCKTMMPISSITSDIFRYRVL